MKGGCAEENNYNFSLGYAMKRWSVTMESNFRNYLASLSFVLGCFTVFQLAECRAHHKVKINLKKCFKKLIGFFVWNFLIENYKQGMGNS